MAAVNPPIRAISGWRTSRARLRRSSRNPKSPNSDSPAATGNWLRAADELVAVDVVGEDRLLDEPEVVLRDLMAYANGGRRVVRRIDVAGHLDLRADGVPHHPADLDIRAEPAPLSGP